MSAGYSVAVPARLKRSKDLVVRRATFLGFTFSLCSIAAVALIAAAMLLQPDPIPVAATAIGRSDVVDRFYDAANEVIATGNRAAVNAVVDPHFASRDPLPGAGPGRDGLADYLVSLHRIDPSLRLIPESVVAAGDLAVAHVVVSSESDLVSLGGVVSQHAPWSRVDVFRIASNAIVEHLSEGDSLALVRPLAEAQFDVPGPSSRVVTVNRISLAPGAEWHSQGAGPDTLYLEAGTLRVAQSTWLAAQSSNARDYRDIDTHPSVSLTTGQSLVIPADSRFTVTNSGAGAARLVVVDIAMPEVTIGDIPPRLPFGVTSQTLAGDVATDVPIGAALLALGEVRLSGGAQLSLSAADGPILVAVDAGQLDVLSSEPAWMRSGDDGTSGPASIAVLAASDGALLHPGSFTLLRNAGDAPVSAVIVTLQSAT